MNLRLNLHIIILQMNYEDFCHIASVCAEQIGPKCRRFFSPSNFMKFEKDEQGRIAILPFYLYVMRTVYSSAMISARLFVVQFLFYFKILKNDLFDIWMRFYLLFLIKQSLLPFFTMVVVLLNLYDTGFIVSPVVTFIYITIY